MEHIYWYQGFNIFLFNFFSTKSAGLTGEFTINIYFDCEEDEIELGKVEDA